MAPWDGGKHRKHEGPLGVPWVMPIPDAAVQLLCFHSTIRPCKMQDLWELFDKTLNLSNLNESMSLVQKQEQFSGG